jgi:hypothetical protein
MSIDYDILAKKQEEVTDYGNKLLGYLDGLLIAYMRLRDSGLFYQCELRKIKSIIYEEFDDNVMRDSYERVKKEYNILKSKQQEGEIKQ